LTDVCGLTDISLNDGKDHSRREKLPAYWVARSKINDPVEYKKYTDLVPDIIAKFGGRVLARGGKFQIMEGPHKFHRFIVIEFPTFERGSRALRRQNTIALQHSGAAAPARSRPSWLRESKRPNFGQLSLYRQPAKSDQVDAKRE